MAVPYKIKKQINQIRDRFTEETGLKYTDPSFQSWLDENGIWVVPKETTVPVVKSLKIKPIGGEYTYPKIKIKGSDD